MALTEDVGAIQDAVERAAEHFRNKDWPALESSMEGVALDLHDLKAKVARVEPRPA